MIQVWMLLSVCGDTNQIKNWLAGQAQSITVNVSYIGGNK